MTRGGSRPGWFMPLAIVLILWGIIGCIACFMQVVLGNVPGAAPEDLALVLAMPLWFNIIYAVATLGALAGAIALVLGSRLAVPLFQVSLVAVVIQFGYVFLATDTWARQGPAGAIFPLVIFTIGAHEIWLATAARRRGWIS